MNKLELYEQVRSMRASLIDQGYIDEHFIRLVQLQDEDTPNFAEDIVTGYFSDSAKLIDNIEQALESRPLDLFVKLDEYIIQFKGSSSSIGARQVNIGCTELREHCNDRNVTGCMLTLQQIKREHADLKGKLETYFELVRRARAASF